MLGGMYRSVDSNRFASSYRAKTEWATERRRLKEQATLFEEAEQKVKDELLRAMVNSSQVRWAVGARIYARNKKRIVIKMADKLCISRQSKAYHNLNATTPEN